MSVALRHETPPHAPEGGWTRRVLGPFHVTGVFWFRLHCLGIRVLPEWAMGSCIALFTTFFWITLRKIRAAIAANLVPVLGPCGWWERQRRIYRTFRTFAWCLSERYERLSTDRAFTVELEGEESWRELASSEQGFVLVTGHLGCWEVGSMLVALRDRCIHVVREAETDPRAQRFIEGLIRSRGGELYATHFADDPHLGMDLLAALRQGDVVALQGDRPRSGGRTAERSLFGRPFHLPIGPAALARAAGVPLVPVFIFREERRRYRCVIRPAIRVGQAPTGSGISGRLWNGSPSTSRKPSGGVLTSGSAFVRCGATWYNPSSFNFHSLSSRSGAGRSDLRRQESSGWGLTVLKGVAHAVQLSHALRSLPRPNVVRARFGSPGNLSGVHVRRAIAALLPVAQTKLRMGALRRP